MLLRQTARSRLLRSGDSEDVRAHAEIRVTRAAATGADSERNLGWSQAPSQRGRTD